MDHPTISKVFDAVATSQGQPYFVMEYVPGEPLSKYCDKNKLSISARLELFVKVCEGVQHARQKAIIHRDMKPANILVVEVDRKPAPRLRGIEAQAIAAPWSPETAAHGESAISASPCLRNRTKMVVESKG